MKVEGTSVNGVSSELVARAVAGDRGAQQRVLESQYDFVRRMLYRLAGSSADIDDLQQTVLLKIVTSLPKFRRSSALSSWVAGICVNVCKDHWRKLKVRAVVQPLEWEVSAGSEHQPEAEAIQREQLRRVYAALGQLSDSQRCAFVLRAAYGYSVDEVAKIMNAHRSTTRLRQYYAKRKFARALAEQGP